LRVGYADSTQNQNKEFLMSIFSAIKNAIFGAPAAAATPSPVAAPAAAAIAAAPAAPVNVEAILTAAAASVDYDTNWQTSIVDLMKLCGLDSSLGNRKELAAELGFTGDTNDSASMNNWLHKQVMHGLAANGGYVPDSLKG
jgi:Domain of unknown function (DUF3597)